MKNKLSTLHCQPHIPFTNTKQSPKTFLSSTLHFLLFPLSFINITTKGKGRDSSSISGHHSPPLRPMSSTDAANPPPPSPADIYASPPVTIILTVILLLFFFIGFFSIYFCRCVMSNLLLTWHIHPNPSGTPVNPTGPTPSPGLDPSIVASFPTFTYSNVKEYRREKVGLECAICLCEFEDDNDLRLLPICCHVFHQECIDLWLESHKSCPFCRRALDAPPEKLGEKSPTVTLHGGGTLRQDIIPEHESLQDTYTIINIKDDNQHEREGITAPSSGSEVTGGPNLAERFARSKSTGHSIVRKGRGGGGGEEEEDRFTLRLPEHVQVKLLRGHQATKSCTTFGEFKSKTSAGNGGFGEVSTFTGDDNKV